MGNLHKTINRPLLLMSYYLNIIIKELFYVFTEALMIFCVSEIIWPGIVLAYININWVLIIWLIVSIIIIVRNKSNKK